MFVHPLPLATAEPTTNDKAPMRLALGGVGGVYFLAEPGELIIDLEKQDRNRQPADRPLRAILVGPDRHLLQDITIADDGNTDKGKSGPIQRARLTAKVERQGVYVLTVTAARDPYGRNVYWGFRTNCPHYMIETARGHRDAVHEEPIELANPDRPCDICFVPRNGQFTMEITRLPKDVDALQVYDGRNQLIETLDVNTDGKATHTFPAGARRDTDFWRLHLPRQYATVQIDGLTRWNRDDLSPDVCLWTPDPSAFFPMAEYGWLLAPYSRTVYGKPGQQGEISFKVQNKSFVEKTIDLSLEFPNTPWPAELSATKVVIPPRQEQQIVLRYTVPSEGQTAVCHLRARPEARPGFSTYSTVTVKAGAAPASKPLAIPMVLKPYTLENEQFGYVPAYPVEKQMYFDLKNRPCIRTDAGLTMLRDGNWSTTDLGRAIAPHVAPSAIGTIGVPSTKVAFDRDGDLYILASAAKAFFLLHSRDEGKTFTAYPIPVHKSGRQTLDMEVFTGHNLSDGPPPILRCTRTAKDPKVFWRSVHDLELLCPTKVDGRIVMPEPVLLSKSAIGLSSHSGIPSCVVSRGDKVHVVWGEATDPEKEVPGVPAFVATYDRATGKFGDPVLVAYGPPANDIHNTPSITIDSGGYLHVLAGTHGRAFPYTHSLKPNDAHSGWSEAVPTGEDLQQTYIGLVCGPDDTLYTVFRLWNRGKEPFPTSYYAALAFQRKRPGQPWEAPQALIVPPLSEYSVYYHRLTIDRTGRLFLNYEHWSTYWFYRKDNQLWRRALMMSPDGGSNWKLVETSDLLPTVADSKAR